MAAGPPVAVYWTDHPGPSATDQPYNSRLPLATRASSSISLTTTPIANPTDHHTSVSHGRSSLHPPAAISTGYSSFNPTPVGQSVSSNAPTGTPVNSSVGSGTTGEPPFSGVQNQRSALSPAARKAVISCSVIGGFLLIAIIVFLLWRRRRRRNQRPAMTLHRVPSTTTFVSAKTRDAKLTALPMYRERRRAKQASNSDTVPILPARVHERLSHHEATFQDLWKTANPPTPIRGSFGSTARSKPKGNTLRPPEMAQIGGAARLTPSIRISSPNIDLATGAASVNDSAEYAVAESIYAPSTIDLEANSYLDSPHSGRGGSLGTDDIQRASWATSYATARSRQDARSTASSKKSSLAQGIKSMQKWLPAKPSPLAGFGSSTSARFKNKATKPNLAPSSWQDISRRQASIGGSVQSQKDVKHASILLDDGTVS